LHVVCSCRPNRSLPWFVTQADKIQHDPKEQFFGGSSGLRKVIAAIFVEPILSDFTLNNVHQKMCVTICKGSNANEERLDKTSTEQEKGSQNLPAVFRIIKLKAKND
jgi:hypothetical protein